MPAVAAPHHAFRRSLPRVGLAILGVLALALPASGCKRPSGEVPASDQPGAIVTNRSAELAPPAKPKRTNAIETLDVPGDKPVLLIVGANERRPIVHLHGMCTDARSDFEAFGTGASEHGTLVALGGDMVCGEGRGGATWTMNAAAIDARIDRALAAVREQRNLDLDASQLVLVGESMGASRATALAKKFPEKYQRLVLVGGPELPTEAELGKTKGVAFVAGEMEPQEKMKKGAERLSSAGIDARFWELPDATHGAYGSDGNRLMSEAIAYVISR